MTGEMHDTLRDELVEALGQCTCPPPIPDENPYDSMQGDCPLHGMANFRADAALPVMRRWADAQVAAERERLRKYRDLVEMTMRGPRKDAWKGVAEMRHLLDRGQP
jgi:hypothetical protein